MDVGLGDRSQRGLPHLTKQETGDQDVLENTGQLEGRGGGAYPGPDPGGL